MSLEVEDNVPDFPRGGGSCLSREELDEVRAEVDAEFEAEERLLKKRKKHSKLQKTRSAEDDLGSLFGGGINGKLPRFANRITLKNISPGMKLWGVVSEVNDKDIVVSLPGGLRGLVRASEAVPPFLQDVEKLKCTRSRKIDKLKDRLRWFEYVLCPSLDALIVRCESMVIKVVSRGRSTPGVAFKECIRKTTVFGVHADLQKIRFETIFVPMILDLCRLALAPSTIIASKLKMVGAWYINIVNLCGRKRAVINQIRSNFYCRLDLPADKIDRFINIFVQKFNVGDTRLVDKELQCLGGVPGETYHRRRRKRSMLTFSRYRKLWEKAQDQLLNRESQIMLPWSTEWSMKWVEHFEVSRSCPSRDKTVGGFFPSSLALVDKVIWCGTVVDTSVRSKEKAICAHQKGDEETKYTGQYVGSYDKIDKSVMVFNSFVTNASIPMHCSVQDLRLPTLFVEMWAGGMILSAYVKSMEDHGYIIHFGLPSFSGFMPKESVDTIPEVLDDYLEFELEDKLFLRGE
ncbi:putative disease resistance protein RGA3-like isoform X1 [Capsicum annuum]|nr:putative disease resistance protein RGA3-like isoform X1 [Capsicum annuum]